MRGRPRGLLALVVLLVLLVAGCAGGDSVDQARAELREQRADAQQTADAIAEALKDSGLEFDGAPRRTGGDPGLRVQYLAEATWDGGTGSQEQRIASVADVVEGLGWTIDQQGARLVYASNDGWRIKVSPSALQGSDDVLISLQGPVVEAPEEAFDELVPVKPERLRP